jgi:hypothetical protein
MTRLNGHFLGVTVDWVSSESIAATFSWSKAGRIFPVMQSATFHDNPEFSRQEYARERPDSDHRTFSGRGI